MENNFFKPAGDLCEDKSDLIYPKVLTSKVTSFRNPGDIGDGYFKPASDLDDVNIERIEKINNNKEIISKIDNNIDKINDYLLTVVSGKKYDSVCSFGVLMGAGRMVVSLSELVQMVEEGYNIVSANVINTNMIEIEFQRYVYDQEKMERWRRF